MNMQRFRPGLLAALLLASLAVHADQPRDALRCVTHEFAPYVFLTDAGLRGIEMDVLAELQRRTALRIDVELQPWSRALRSVETGAADCIFSAFRTPDREAFLTFTSMPIHMSHIHVYTHRQVPVPFRELADLKGRRVALVRGFKTSPAFDRAVADGWFDIEEVTEVAQTFRLLDRRRVDLVLYNRHVGDRMLLLLGLPDIERQTPALTSSAAYIAFSRVQGHETLVPVVDQALFEILADGTYRDIFARYDLSP